MEESSFACKSVEIVNAKTIVSRNNTEFEVYQYHMDESFDKTNNNHQNGNVVPATQGEQSMILSCCCKDYDMLDDIAEGVNRKQSERIRAAVTDYLASSQLKKQ
jgi:hypothetical protein